MALAAPALAVFAVVGNRSPYGAIRTVQLGAAVSAAAWVVLLLAGGRGRVALFHLTPLVAAGGCGAALLAAAVLEEEQPSRRAPAVVGTALVVLCLGLAGARGALHVVALTAGLALAAVLTVDATPPEDRALPALLVLLGSVAALVGAGALLVGDDRWDLPEAGTVSRAALVVLVAAAAAFVVAATLRWWRPTALLLPGGLVLGLAAAPLRPGDHDVAWMAVVLAVAAVTAAAIGRERGPMALGLLALAAACASPGLAPASRLLAVAAVVAAASGRPVALLTAVPAGVALAGGVVGDGGWAAVVLATAGTAVAALLARGAAAPPGVGSPRAQASPGLVPVAVVGAWLVLAPGSWAWSGADLGHYDRGLARGLAAAAVVVAAAIAGPRVAPRLAPHLGRLAPRLAPRRRRLR